VPDEKPEIGLDDPFQYLWPVGTRERGQIGTRTLNSLGREGVKTVRDLTDLTILDITDMRGAGAGSVDEVRKRLTAHGFCLKGDSGAVSAAELEARVRTLMLGGLRRVAATRFAYECWPKGEIAPGVMLEVAE
jgi:hypothetical protein